jgi:hypothetical protein
MPLRYIVVAHRWLTKVDQFIQVEQRTPLTVLPDTLTDRQTDRQTDRLIFLLSCQF